MSWKHLLIASAALLVAACGEQPTTAASPAANAAPSPTPAPVGAGASDPLSAVRALFPARGACFPSGGQPYSAAAGCPITPRLAQRLGTNPGGHADPICRCQNHPDPVTVTLVSQSNSSAIVKVDESFPGLPYVVQFVVVKIGGRWYVDDSYCADPSTSIYAATPVKPCTS